MSLAVDAAMESIDTMDLSDENKLELAERLRTDVLDKDQYATVIDAIRIHDEGDGWVIDGVDSTTGQYTATLRKYGTFEDAAKNVPVILEDLKADGVVFRTVS